jgi:hypothetical protein
MRCCHVRKMFEISQCRFTRWSRFYCPCGTTQYSYFPWLTHTSINHAYKSSQTDRSIIVVREQPLPTSRVSKTTASHTNINKTHQTQLCLMNGNLQCYLFQFPRNYHQAIHAKPLKHSIFTSSYSIHLWAATNFILNNVISYNFFKKQTALIKTFRTDIFK